MDQGFTIEHTGSGLPQRRFASTLYRAVTTAAECRRHGFHLRLCGGLLLLATAAGAPLLGQQTGQAAAATVQAAQQETAQQQAARQFVLERSTRAAQGMLAQRAGAADQSAASGEGAASMSPAQAMVRARAQHLALAARRRVYAHSTANLSAAWQQMGPSSVASTTYNNITGRITSIAVDPNDATGNTVYLGTTGGGVWKSTNAAGSLSAATFAPLTDTLPVFSANAGGSAIPSLSIGAVAVQPTSNPVVIAGTGDPNDATDSLYGEGLLISSDGGLTWTLVQQSEDGVSGSHSFIGLAAAGIAFSSATPATVVAAFSTSAQAAVVNATTYVSIPGLYYSTDAGQTWKMASIYDGGTVVQQPQPIGASSPGNAVTSVVWDAQRGMFFAAVRSHGYYSSPDGAVWTRLAAQPGTGLTSANCPVGAAGTGSATCPIFRGTLAVQPVTGDLYALTVDSNNVDQGLWQDLCNATSGGCATAAPVFANRIDNGALDASGNTISQGNYNLALNAAPAASNGTNLYVGTVDLYRCAMAANSPACTLRDTTNALDGCNAPAQVAPAQHALASVAQSSGEPILYLGNDSGLWRSLDGVAETGSVCSSSDASHFDNLNAAIGVGGSLAEVIGFAQDPTTANTLIAGLGGNGSAATPSASTLAAWPQISTGEGGFPSIDPNTPADWYVTVGAGVNLDACTQGIDCNATDFVSPATIGATQVDGDASLLDAPTLLDPAVTASLLIGTCRVWRGPAGSGSGWSNADALSPALGGSTTPCSQFSPLIRSLGAGGPNATGPTLANSGSQVIYAGLSGSLDGGELIPGHVFVTQSASTATSSIPWTDVAQSPVSNDSSDNGQFNPGQFDISSLAVDPHDATGATVYATVMGFGVPHVYRSTNFGASWLNVTANLPDAPANAVIVDPNDANTVYVAMDTGVYATQTISSCGSTPPTNCWSVMGTSLPNSPVVALAAGANLPTGDGRDGLLRAGTYGRGLWQTPLLTAAVPTHAAMTLSATDITFPAQQAGTQSAAQTLTITSSGDAPVTFTTLQIAGDFTETDDCAGQTIAPGSSCSVQIIFAPASTGALQGGLTIFANIPGGQTTVALSGTGTAAASIVLTPLSLTFPATIVNQTSPSQIITVANTGGTPATLHAPVILGETGDFAIYASTCTATLGPQTACSISIVFTPTVSGARSATLSVTDSIGTQTASLSGVGDAPATDTLSTSALTFAQQEIGTSSTAQRVVLTNAGGVPLTLIAASVSAGDFSVVNACGNSLAAHATCAFNVIFSPTAVGARSGTLTITDQFRHQTVALTGTGIAGPGVSLTPLSLSFPPTGVGLAAVAQTLTLTNNGSQMLNIAGLAASSGFNIAANTCGTSLAINAACTLTVVFAPAAAGPAEGTLTFTDNAPSGVQTTRLTGTGIDFSLAATGATSLTVKGSGGSATYPMQLTSLAGLPGSAALSCSGAPANSICTVVPGSAALGGTTLVSVTVEVGVAGAAVAAAARPAMPERRRNSEELLVFAMLLPVGLFARRGRALKLMLMMVFACSLGALSGCGVARTIPVPGSTGTTAPTPSGTYTLTVSATSAGITHSVNLSLVVQ